MSIKKELFLSLSRTPYPCSTLPRYMGIPILVRNSILCCLLSGDATNWILSLALLSHSIESRISYCTSHASTTPAINQAFQEAGCCYLWRSSLIEGTWKQIPLNAGFFISYFPLREESQEKQEDDDEWRPNEEQFVLSFVDVEGFVSLMIHCDVVNIRNLSLFATWLRSDAIRTLISKM